MFEFKRPELRVVLDNELRTAARAISKQRLEEMEMEQSFNTHERSTEEEEAETGGLLSFFNSSPSQPSQPPPPISPKKTEDAPFMRLYNIDTPTKNTP